MSVAHQTPAFTNVISQGERGADRKKVVSNEVGYRCSRNHDTDMQITAVWRAQIETEPWLGKRRFISWGRAQIRTQVSMASPASLGTHSPHFLWVLGPSQGKRGHWMGVRSLSDWERLAHRMTEQGWGWRCGDLGRDYRCQGSWTGD